MGDECITKCPAPSRLSPSDLLHAKAKHLRNMAHDLEKLADRLPPLNGDLTSTLFDVINAGLSQIYSSRF